MTALEELYWTLLFGGITFISVIFYIAFIYEPKKVREYENLLNKN
jgi:hypothetical protein